MKEWFEVVFYSGDGLYPAYYLIDKIKCESLEEVLKVKLGDITKRVRKMFCIERDIPNWKIYEAIYIFQVNGLVPIMNFTKKRVKIKIET